MASGPAVAKYAKYDWPLAGLLVVRGRVANGAGTTPATSTAAPQNREAQGYAVDIRSEECRRSNEQAVRGPDRSCPSCDVGRGPSPRITECLLLPRRV